MRDTHGRTGVGRPGAASLSTGHRPVTTLSSQPERAMVSGGHQTPEHDGDVLGLGWLAASGRGHVDTGAPRDQDGRSKSEPALPSPA
jgi:hypothetical protein